MNKTTSISQPLEKHEGHKKLSIAQVDGKSRLSVNVASDSSGIAGLDKILDGGYLHNRLSLIRGDSGTGKTVFALMFATSGMKDDTAVYASFDESVKNLESYLRDYKSEARVHFLDFTNGEDILKSGESGADLAGLLVRIKHALQQLKAKKLILDGIDVLFARYQTSQEVRKDVSQLFGLCRENNITMLSTAGTDRGYSVPRGVLDYASDSTIYLKQVVTDGLMTRTLRVVKMRGRSHGTNEYPFLIDDYGISVMPVTTSNLDRQISENRLSLGSNGIDVLLGGMGVYEGSVSLISGQAGSGKTLLALSAAEALCNAGRKTLYISLEQPSSEILRDASNAGISLEAFLEDGTFEIDSVRAEELGLEQHIILLLRLVENSDAEVLIVDPLSSLSELGSSGSFKNMAIRLTQALRKSGVTIILTELWHGESSDEYIYPISSIVDTWIKVLYERDGLTMRRLMTVAKSRGSRSSSQIMNFEITQEGLFVS